MGQICNEMAIFFIQVLHCLRICGIHNGDIIMFFHTNLLQLSLHPNKGVIAFC
jgi:hypothetical protein